jgi:hypothetical protein
MKQSNALRDWKLFLDEQSRMEIGTNFWSYFIAGMSLAAQPRNIVDFMNF